MTGWGMIRRLVAGLVCGMAVAGGSQAQKSDDPATLNAEVMRLYRAGKFVEASVIGKRSLAIAEKMLGPDHLAVAQSLNNLAFVYQAQGRYADAEPLYKRSLTIYEKELGRDHPAIGQSLHNLATLYRVQGRFAEAQSLVERSLAIREKALGAEHMDVGMSLHELAFLYTHLGRIGQAEPLYRRSLTIYEKLLGSEHPVVGTALNNLSELYREQGRLAEAEPLQRRSLAIREKALGAEHPDVAQSLHNLGLLYHDLGRLTEAEPLVKRSLAIREKALGAHHPLVGSALNNLAELYRKQGRFAEAEPLQRRSLTMREKALGPEHSDVIMSLNNLALLYQDLGRLTDVEPLYRRILAFYEKALGADRNVGKALNNLSELYREQGRLAEAEPLQRRSLAIREKALGPEHPDVAQSLHNLAALQVKQGRLTEAEPLVRRSLAIREKVFGPDHPLLGDSLSNLASLYEDQGRLAEAELHYRRGLAIREKGLGPDHPNVGWALSNLARLAVAQRDWAQAAAYWRRSTSIIERRARSVLMGDDEGSSKGEAQRINFQFVNLVKMTYRLPGGREPGSPTADMFETAQWALSSEAAASLALMAARSAKGSRHLAEIVRERQDLVGERRLKDKLLIAAKSEPPATRKVDAEKAIADRLAAIDTRLAEVAKRLAQDFPNYAALVSTVPVSVAEVQADLGADEALVLFLDTAEWRPLPEETFVWIVTKSSQRWVRSELGTAALTREIAALRCGLDGTAWYGEGAKKCAQALSLPPAKIPAPDQPLPFDHDRAHKLYLALFGEVQDLTKGKHLLVVPSGPLTQLPFQVLLTQPLSSGGHRTAAWLARQHAITVLPAVSSLKALRSVGRPSAAPRPMIGFGNPLLNGPDERYAGYAKLAREKQRCPENRPQERVARVSNRNVVAPVETRGGLADLSSIKRQLPLPETADELCAVARDVKAEVGDVRLGARATEREVKRLSASGYLAQFRLVHFATHGFLSGQLDSGSEPGLILTPPDLATEEDDGYLSASEIAALKLDADWVILSACNTAAGAAKSAEALSGLARAFIYAQARALLVSHWEVYSNATVKLIVAALREMARDPKVGRAEALRRSMLVLIDKGEPHEAHPAYWAPFVVVGEGAAAR